MMHGREWKGKIGLTGGIASGKSTVSQEFAACGASIIDADAIAHSIIEPGRSAYQPLLDEFGDGILDGQGRISRELLRAIVFHDSSRRLIMNTIMHPLIRDEMLRQYDQIRSVSPDTVILHDIPLLIETGLYQAFSTIILVWVDLATQIARLAARDTLSQKDAEKLLAMQYTLDKKRDFSTYIIDNSGTREQTQSQVKSLYENLRRLILPSTASSTNDSR